MITKINDNQNFFRDIIESVKNGETSLMPLFLNKGNHANFVYNMDTHEFINWSLYSNYNKSTLYPVIEISKDFLSKFKTYQFSNIVNEFEYQFLIMQKDYLEKKGSGDDDLVDIFAPDEPKTELTLKSFNLNDFNFNYLQEITGAFGAMPTINKKIPECFAGKQIKILVDGHDFKKFVNDNITEIVFNDNTNIKKDPNYVANVIFFNNLIDYFNLSCLQKDTNAKNILKTILQSDLFQKILLDDDQEKELSIIKWVLSNLQHSIYADDKSINKEIKSLLDCVYEVETNLLFQVGN